ncbi:MAG TPA: carboxymuconolactone decarboxylase family protein [Burkholderiaceae bacterium]|nr:carboxymuconolactone decarboxylase family protein [Burkholderiaceae bacterium]
MLAVLVLAAGCASTPVPATAEHARLTEPRIRPLPESQWTAEQRAELDRYRMPNGQYPNLLTTLANHPRLWTSFTDFSNYIASGSTLPPRDRELLILRTAWLNQSDFELGWHVLRGRSAGLTDEDFRRIKEGPLASGWVPFDAALIRAADELHADAFIGDATWAILAERYDRRQLMDVTFTVGQYNLLAMFLNSAGVQLDVGVPRFPGEK